MSNISLGIDISKSDISVALLKEQRTFKSKFANDDSGFRKLNQWLQKIQAPDVKIAMEATGHYYVPLAEEIQTYKVAHKSCKKKKEFIQSKIEQFTNQKH